MLEKDYESTSIVASENDELFTLEGLNRMCQLSKPGFYFEPVKIESPDPFEIIVMPYRRFAPAINHHGVLYGSVAIDVESPKKKYSAKEFYKRERHIERLVKRIWRMKVCEQVVRLAAKKSDEMFFNEALEELNSIERGEFETYIDVFGVSLA
jgi:hypothetical protein